MRKYLTEFIGTFFLVLTICLAVQSGQPLAVLAIGTVLMVLVYMGGHVSGAQYNPAVGLAVTMRGAMEGKELVPYWVSQIAGATLAAVAGQAITGKTTPIAPGPGVALGTAVLVEVLFTFLLALVVLNVATSKKTEGNPYYGLAIGSTIIAAALAAGGVSGGAFNPAVGIGLTVAHATMGGGGFDNVWIYIVGPFAGAALAALVFKIQEPEHESS